MKVDEMFQKFLVFFSNNFILFLMGKTIILNVRNKDPFWYRGAQKKQWGEDEGADWKSQMI